MQYELYANEAELNTFRMINYDDFTIQAALHEEISDEQLAVGASTVPEDEQQSFIDTFFG